MTFLAAVVAKVSESRSLALLQMLVLMSRLSLGCFIFCCCCLQCKSVCILYIYSQVCLSSSEAKHKDSSSYDIVLRSDHGEGWFTADHNILPGQISFEK